MDNSPRNAFLDRGGTGVDISSEMVLFARNMIEIAQVLGYKREARLYRNKADELAARINRLMWSKSRNFYFDLALDGKPVPVKTIAAYWALLAGVATPGQAKFLAEELQNPESFGRIDPIPTCAANEPGYYASGGYWRGAVWAPTNTMVIRGLEKYGYPDLARSIAKRHLQIVAEVFDKTGTIWENYAPDAKEPGRNTDSSLVAKDFVGWSGIAPILYFLEYGIGLKPDAARNELLWRIESSRRVGCERYRFNGHVVTLLAEPAATNGNRQLLVNADGTFRLDIVYHGKKSRFNVRSGVNKFVLH